MFNIFDSYSYIFQHRFVFKGPGPTRLEESDFDDGKDAVQALSDARGQINTMKVEIGGSIDTGPTVPGGRTVRETFPKLEPLFKDLDVIKHDHFDKLNSIPGSPMDQEAKTRVEDFTKFQEEATVLAAIRGNWTLESLKMVFTAQMDDLASYCQSPTADKWIYDPVRSGFRKIGLKDDPNDPEFVGGKPNENRKLLDRNPMLKRWPLATVEAALDQAIYEMDINLSREYADVIDDGDSDCDFIEKYTKPFYRQYFKDMALVYDSNTIDEAKEWLKKYYYARIKEKYEYENKLMLKRLDKKEKKKAEEKKEKEERKTATYDAGKKALRFYYKLYPPEPPWLQLLP